MPRMQDIPLGGVVCGCFKYNLNIVVMYILTIQSQSDVEYSKTVSRETLS